MARNKRAQQTTEGETVLISRALASLIGAVIFLYGLVAAFSPLPFGAPLVILGFLTIAAANPAARPLLRRLRRRWRWFDILVRRVGKQSNRFDDLLDETAPADETSAPNDDSRPSGNGRTP